MFLVDRGRLFWMESAAMLFSGVFPRRLGRSAWKLDTACVSVSAEHGNIQQDMFRGSPDGWARQEVEDVLGFYIVVLGFSV